MTGDAGRRTPEPTSTPEEAEVRHAESPEQGDPVPARQRRATAEVGHATYVPVGGVGHPAGLAALQQSVGNRATTAVVQRGKHKKDDDEEWLPAAKRKKGPGDSSKLATARWRRKARGGGIKKPDWKRGYEAQHIIPSAVAVRLRMPTDRINEAWNGMMLPAGRKAKETPAAYKAQSKFLALARHIAVGKFAHPIYSRNVTTLARNYYAHHNLKSWTQAHMEQFAAYLRKKTKTAKQPNIDAITFGPQEHKNI